MNKYLNKGSQPSGWALTSIGEIIDFEYGKGLPKKERNENGEFPVYGSNGIVGYHDDFLVEAPSIIIGRKGAAGEVSYSDKDCWPIDTTYFVRKLNYFNPKFVFYLLKSLRLNQYEKSTAIPGLNRNDAYEIAINLPSYSEQNQITSKIEELFSELDNGIKNLKKVQDQLKIYRQAVLKYAFEGKLTEKWRNEKMQSENPPESAEKLLKRIRKKREEYYQKQLEDWQQACEDAKNTGGKQPSKPKKLKELEPLVEKELFESPELPEKWKWIRLGFLANITGGLTKNPKRKFFPIQYPFLRVANVYSNHLNLEEIHKIGLEEKELNRVLLQNQDLLIVEGNGSIEQIGRVAIWKDEIQPCVHQNHLIKVRLFFSKTAKFVLYWLLSHQGRLQIKREASSTSGLYTLSLSKVNNLPIPLCSVHEQEQIVSEIESRLSVCDQLEKTIEDSLQKSEALRQSILKKAFSGELTAEWRKNHPELISGENSAEKLLERIKAEKEKALSASTPRKTARTTKKRK